MKQTLYAVGTEFKPVKAEQGVIYLTPDDLPTLQLIRDWALTTHSHERHVTGFLINHYFRFYHVSAPSAAALQSAVSLLRRLSGVNLVTKADDGDYYYIYTGTYEDEGISGADKEKIEAVSNRLINFFDRVVGLPTDCTDDLYQKYKDTGVYVVGSEVQISSSATLRYSVPISAEANLQYNKLRTSTEKQHTAQQSEQTNQQSEITFQENLKTIQSTDDALQTASEDIEQRYASAIQLSKILRYAAIAIAAIVIIVIIILIIRLLK